MSVLEIILVSVLLLAALLLIFVILKQKSKTEGLNSILGGNTSESFFSKNRNSTKEAKYVLLTKISMFVLVISAIALSVSFAMG